MNKKSESKVKIFVIYHKPSFLFKNEVFTPIQSGSELSNINLKTLKDNTGDNISYKNKHYAELTANYWVWKNFLKEEPDTEYIGFCHYRRFLDFSKDVDSSSKKIKKFKKLFKERYSEKDIYPYIKDYDIILPEISILDETVYNQYTKAHPKKDMDLLIDIVKKDYPDMTQDIEDVLSGKEIYFCLNYVMKKELFDEYMNWVFDIIPKLEKITNWDEYTDYYSEKVPAYIMERFLTIWIRYKIRTSNITIKEKAIYIIVFKNKFFPGISINIDNENKKKTLKIFGLKIPLKY